MSLLPLHLLGSPVLRQRSAEVATVDDDLQQFVADLFETMQASKGVGLAANQVGVARRVAVVETEEVRLVLINPVIVAAEGRDSAEEGCLSIPEVYAEVTRPARVTLEATGLDGQRYTWEGEGLAARAVQHEIDHLDGILFLDHLGPIKRKMLLARYRKEHKDENFIKEVGSTAAGSP
jgi:peptide deformylase